MKMQPLAAVRDTVVVGSVHTGRAVTACERTTLAAENLFGSRSRGLQCSVRRAMLFAHFSDKEASNKGLQRRREQLCMERMVKGPLGPPNSLDCTNGEGGDLSCLTSSKESPAAFINLEELAKISA